MTTGTDAPLIHVGLHKCGSTFLQNRIFADPKTGFRAPWGGMSNRAVTDFAVCEPLAFDPERLKAIYAESDPGPGADGTGQVPVISHEALSSRPFNGQYYAPDVAGRLHKVFPNARILIIFREQASILRSLHVQHVRTGGRQDLRTFLGTGKEPEGWQPMIALTFFEYDRMIRMYRDFFGADRVLALPLELLQRDPAAFSARLFGFVDLPDPGIDPAERVNSAWQPPLTEFYRRTNGVISRNPLNTGDGFLYRFRERAMWALSNRLPRKLGKAATDRDKAFLKSRLGEHFAPSNARTAELTGLDLGALGYQLPES